MRADELRNWLQEEQSTAAHVVHWHQVPLISMVDEIDRDLQFKGRSEFMSQANQVFQAYREASQAKLPV